MSRRRAVGIAIATCAALAAAVGAISLWRAHAALQRVGRIAEDYTREICRSWDLDALRNHATPAFAQHCRGERASALFESLRVKLGPVDSISVTDITLTADGRTGRTANVKMRSYFAKGTVAGIELEMRQPSKGQWQISKFKVSGN